MPPAVASCSRGPRGRRSMETRTRGSKSCGAPYSPRAPQPRLPVAEDEFRRGRERRSAVRAVGASKGLEGECEMAQGCLEVSGKIDLAQFWPDGDADADTTRVKVTVGANAFRFRKDNRSSFQ